MINYKIIKNTSIITLIILIYSSCTLKSLPTNSAKPVISLLPPSSEPLDNHISTVTPSSPTFTPGNTHYTVIASYTVPTPLLSSTNTSESTITHTVLTPGPTIAPELRQGYLLDLYKSNGGCKLPCWWGFTIRITKWSEINDLFKRFDASLTLYQGIYTIQHVFKDTGIQLAEAFSIKNDYLDSIVFGGSIVRNKKIILGDPFYNQIFTNYQLSALLLHYGPPDSVFIRTFPGAPEGGNIPFYLIVEYNQLGISAKYSGEVVIISSEYRICPQKVNIDILLWSPEKSDQAALQQMRDVNFVSDIDFTGYKSLKTAFNMNQQEFYETFSISGNKNCLTAKPEDWDF